MQRVASVLVIPFVLAVLVGAPLAAQAPQPAFPPAQPATDLESALYKAADAIGMLRGPQERDGIVTLEYWATGSIDLQGRNCQLTDYRASVRYPAADRGKKIRCRRCASISRVAQPEDRRLIGMCRW